MNKHLLNLPVILAAVFSLAATAVIAVISFSAPPTMLLDEHESPLQPVPAFVVFDQDGKQLTRDDMLGKVWVCDFFLTQCSGICPMLGQAMAGLALEMESDRALRDVQMISFSVDPETDTLEVLFAYRNSWGPTWSGGDETKWEVIADRWQHTTSNGDRQAFWAIVESGFFLSVEVTENDPTTPVSHSSKLVLVDARGRIRGYYDGLLPEEIDTLLHDLRRVVDED